MIIQTADASWRLRPRYKRSSTTDNRNGLGADMNPGFYGRAVDSGVAGFSSVVACTYRCVVGHVRDLPYAAANAIPSGPDVLQFRVSPARLPDQAGDMSAWIATAHEISGCQRPCVRVYAVSNEPARQPLGI